MHAHRDAVPSAGLSQRHTPAGIEEAVAAEEGVAVDEYAAEAPCKWLRQIRGLISGQRVLPLPH